MDNFNYILFPLYILLHITNKLIFIKGSRSLNSVFCKLVTVNDEIHTMKYVLYEICYAIMFINVKIVFYKIQTFKNLNHA